MSWMSIHKTLQGLTVATKRFFWKAKFPKMLRSHDRYQQIYVKTFKNTCGGPHF